MNIYLITSLKSIYRFYFMGYFCVLVSNFSNFYQIYCNRHWLLYIKFNDWIIFYYNLCKYVYKRIKVENYAVSYHPKIHEDKDYLCKHLSWANVMIKIQPLGAGGAV